MDEWSPPIVETLSEELLQFVKPELQPGERLLWAATAQPRPSTSVKFPFTSLNVTIACLGLCVASFWAIFGPPRPRFQSVEGLLIGTGIASFIVGLIAGLVSLDALWNRLHPDDHADNTYALTDRRAIIWVPVRGSTGVEVHAIPRGSLKKIHRLEYPDLSGDVLFDCTYDEHHHGPSGFEGVSQVRYVEDLARRTLIDHS